MGETFTYANLVNNWKIILNDFKNWRKNGEWTKLKHNCLAIVEVHLNHKIDINDFTKPQLEKARDLLNCAFNIFRIIDEKWKDRDKQVDIKIKEIGEIINGKVKYR